MHQAKTNHEAPTVCNDGMCRRKSTVVLVEVNNSGENELKAFSQVSERDNYGNVTNHMQDRFEFIGWRAWCPDCYMKHIDKKQGRLL